MCSPPKGRDQLEYLRHTEHEERDEGRKGYRKPAVPNDNGQVSDQRERVRHSYACGTAHRFTSKGATAEVHGRATFYARRPAYHSASLDDSS